MSACVSGTFSTGANVAGLGDQQSDILDVPLTSGALASLSTVGLDANNRVRLQKSVDSGNTWTTISNLSGDVTNATNAAAGNTQWRLITVAMQANRTISYKLSAES